MNYFQENSISDIAKTFQNNLGPKLALLFAGGFGITTLNLFVHQAMLSYIGAGAFLIGFIAIVVHFIQALSH